MKGLPACLLYDAPKIMYAMPSSVIPFSIAPSIILVFVFNLLLFLKPNFIFLS